MNSIQFLYQKRTRLVRLKESYRVEFEQKCKEIDEEIEEIDSALDVVNKAIEPYLCKRCQGSGSIRMPDAAGQMEDITCPDCKGTGIKEDS